MRTAIATTFAAAMLAASSMAFAEDMNTNDATNGTMTDQSTTGSVVAPDGSEDLKTFCNSNPDEAKCNATNMGETNKGN